MDWLKTGFVLNQSIILSKIIPILNSKKLPWAAHIRADSTIYKRSFVPDCFRAVFHKVKIVSPQIGGDKGLCPLKPRAFLKAQPKLLLFSNKTLL